jgi:hypothetical protein
VGRRGQRLNQMAQPLGMSDRTGANFASPSKHTARQRRCKLPRPQKHPEHQRRRLAVASLSRAGVPRSRGTPNNCAACLEHLNRSKMESVNLSTYPNLIEQERRKDENIGRDRCIGSSRFNPTSVDYPSGKTRPFYVVIHNSCTLCAGTAQPRTLCSLNRTAYAKKLWHLMNR